MSFQLIPDPWFWFLAVVAVLLTGISKSGVGGGAGGVSTPLMSMAISPVAAAAIMLPVLCVMDLFGIRAYLWKWDKVIARRVVGGGLIGCALGYLTFSWLDDNWIRIILGAIALGFLAFSYFPKKSLARPSNLSGWLWSALSGCTTFITHAGGPPLMVYLLQLRLDKTTFIAVSLVFFAAMNYAKILPYFWLGLFDARNLATSVVLIPLGVIGIYIGVRLQRHLEPRMFYAVVHTLLFLTGIKLLYDGLTHL
ncbi:MAG TPA: sulfite exporter TauE/SafE family protein [Burkholderiales bacterium]|nr:sulfite exporter TauE/SafE family protein [Burkholderiales bacterium]